MVLPDLPPSITSQKANKDYVTPHKISLLLLIKEFCVVKNPYLYTKHSSSMTNLWTHENKHNREFSIAILKLIQNPDMELKELLSFILPILHPNTYRLFADRQLELRKNGIAGLMDYIATLDALLVEPAPVVPVIHKSSVLGLFIRRMFLAFDKLSFSQVTKLYCKFNDYYDAAFGNLDASIDLDFSDLDNTNEREPVEIRFLASQKQAEYLIAQQAALLQINDGVALSPPELHQKIKELLKGNPDLAEAHYLSYLNMLRIKEYTGAQENLYHHFDRNTVLSLDSKANPGSEDLSRSSRYAALNLAILHTLFGHNKEAITALNEAIMLAQEVNDNICLQYALAWLYRLETDNQEILIERSIAKSSELGLWCLSSLGIQALSKLRCFTSSMPTNNFELLIKSDIQNCQHSMTDILGQAFVLKSALWSYYGHSMMSNLSSQMLLYLNTSDPIRGGVCHIGESFCLALRNLTMLYAQEGEYSNSELLLSLSKILFPPCSAHSHIWQTCELLIIFEQALYSGKWLKAQKTVEGIAIFDKEEANYRRAQLIMHQGDLAEADELLRALITRCDKEKVSPHYHVRVLLLRAELLSMTDNYAFALPSLMTCREKCKNYHLTYLEALTTYQIASIQLMMSLPNQALRLLNSVFISFLNNGSCYDTGCCCFLYARCQADVLIDQENKEYKAFLPAILMSNKALEYLRKTKAINKMKLVLCWQAHIYNYLEMTEERNNISHKFRYLEDEINYNC